ncbi:hypothetical protein [Maribacter luteus]|uniref:PKD domain-containing protein n=1 Tax=Maribacter luteus TaxID=2594478 RepID=A0A6I2MPH4_9FLAO|nr:hypothetical protein [Maribacter luteus]MRX63156.1 hypothetical protein [Maribacter luteus]
MNFYIKLKNVARFFTLGLATVVLFSCQPEEWGDGNGLYDTDLDASFTITPVSDSNNTYLLSANGSYISSNWDLGTGAGFYSGGGTEEIFLPDAGTYSISHKVVGKGGVSETTSQELEVEVSDPVAGNIVKGGLFEDADDHAEWTVLNISDSGAYWTFNEGSATIVASGWNQQAIYQAIDVVADKEYKIDMVVSGEGNDETWFEVMASTVEPIQGQDYANDIVMGLNTWGGCGTGTISGLLSSVGCVGNSYSDSISNSVTFDTSGTIYLVIKCGGNQTPGISISRVEMRGSN